MVRGPAFVMFSHRMPRRSLSHNSFDMFVECGHAVTTGCMRFSASLRRVEGAADGGAVAFAGRPVHTGTNAAIAAIACGHTIRI